MMAMTIKVTRVMKMADTPGMVLANIAVQVPGLSARAMIDMEFPAQAGSDRDDWAEIAYANALMMLDPA